MSAKITESQFRALVESSLRGGPDVAGSTAPLQLTSVLIFARKAHFYKIAYWSLRAGTDRTKTICMKEIEDAVEKLQAKTYKEAPFVRHCWRSNRGLNNLICTLL